MAIADTITAELRANRKSSPCGSPAVRQFNWPNGEPRYLCKEHDLRLGSFMLNADALPEIAWAPPGFRCGYCSNDETRFFSKGAPPNPSWDFKAKKLVPAIVTAAGLIALAGWFAFLLGDALTSTLF